MARHRSWVGVGHGQTIESLELGRRAFISLQETCIKNCNFFFEHVFGPLKQKPRESQTLVCVSGDCHCATRLTATSAQRCTNQHADMCTVHLKPREGNSLSKVDFKITKQPGLFACAAVLKMITVNQKASGVTTSEEEGESRGRFKLKKKD